MTTCTLYVSGTCPKFVGNEEKCQKLNFQNVNIRHFLQVMYSLSQLSKKG